MPGATAFALADIERAGALVHITITQAGHLAESQAAVQADERHQPCLTAAGVELGQQPVGLAWSKVALAGVVRARHVDLTEGQRAVVKFPGHHAAHDTADERDRVTDGLRRAALPSHAGHEVIQDVGRYLVQRQGQQLLQVATDQRVFHLCALAVSQQPVAPVALVGIIKAHGGRRGDDFSTGLGGEVAACLDGFLPDLGGKLGRDAFTQPAYVTTDTAARCGISVVDGIADVRASVVAADATLSGLHTGEACGFSRCSHTLVPPYTPLCDHFATRVIYPYRVWQHRKRYRPPRYSARATVASCGNANTNGLLSSRPQVRFLPGAPQQNQWDTGKNRYPIFLALRPFCDQEVARLCQ